MLVLETGNLCFGTLLYQAKPESALKWRGLPRNPMYFWFSLKPADANIDHCNHASLKGFKAYRT